MSMEFYEDLADAMKNLSERGAFLTVKGENNVVNTMTIGWGFVGFSWKKPYFIAMVRPQRYTREILSSADSFTISIPYNDDMKNALNICGSRSGRDTDKKAAAGIRFVPAEQVSSPVVDNCQMYYECKIDYVDSIHTDKLPKDMADKYYTGDYHDLFYGEIVACYKK